MGDVLHLPVCFTCCGVLNPRAAVKLNGQWFHADIEACLRTLDVRVQATKQRKKVRHGG